MILRLALIALLAFQPSSAIPQTLIPQSEVYAGMPPERFRHATTENIRVVFGHVEMCGTPDIADDPGAHFASCIRYGGLVILPNPCDYGDREEFARLACHEQAHLEGWPKDHGA